jgi:hypothetical protein
MIAMGGQVRQDAAKADGAEAFGDEEVVLFSAATTMYQHEIAHNAAGCRQGYALLRHLVTDDLAAFSELATGIRFTEKTGGTVGAGERL